MDVTNTLAIFRYQTNPLYRLYLALTPVTQLVPPNQQQCENIFQPTFCEFYHSGNLISVIKINSIF